MKEAANGIHLISRSLVSEQASMGGVDQERVSDLLLMGKQ